MVCFVLDLLLHWNSHHSLVTRWLSFAFIPSSSPPFVACQLAQVFAQWVTLITIIIGPFSIIGRSVAIGATMGKTPRPFRAHRSLFQLRFFLPSHTGNSSSHHTRKCMCRWTSNTPQALFVYYLLPLPSMYAHSHTHTTSRVT